MCRCASIIYNVCIRVTLQLQKYRLLDANKWDNS